MGAARGVCRKPTGQHSGPSSRGVICTPRRRRINVVATSRFGCRLPRPRSIRRVAPGPLTAPHAGGARAGKHLAGAGGRTARRKRRLAPRQGRGVATALLPATRAPGPRPGRRRPARPAGRRDHPRPVRRTRWTPAATSLSPESRIWLLWLSRRGTGSWTCSSDTARTPSGRSKRPAGLPPVKTVVTSNSARTASSAASAIAVMPPWLWPISMTSSPGWIPASRMACSTPFVSSACRRPSTPVVPRSGPSAVPPQRAPSSRCRPSSRGTCPRTWSACAVTRRHSRIPTSGTAGRHGVGRRVIDQQRRAGRWISSPRTS